MVSTIQERAIMPLPPSVFEPLLFVTTQFFRAKLAASGMFVVVAMNLRVTFKANRNRIVDRIRPPVSLGHNVICFNFHTAKAMTDTTSPMAGNEQLIDLISWKCHRVL
jgi:hypothetical protein